MSIVDLTIGYDSTTPDFKPVSCFLKYVMHILEPKELCILFNLFCYRQCIDAIEPY